MCVKSMGYNNNRGKKTIDSSNSQLDIHEVNFLHVLNFKTAHRKMQVRFYSSLGRPPFSTPPVK